MHWVIQATWNTTAQYYLHVSKFDGRDHPEWFAARVDGAAKFSTKANAEKYIKDMDIEDAVAVAVPQ